MSCKSVWNAPSISQLGVPWDHRSVVGCPKKVSVKLTICPSSEDGGANVSSQTINRICGRDSDVERTLFGEAAPPRLLTTQQAPSAYVKGSHLVWRSAPEPHCNLRTGQRGTRVRVSGYQKQGTHVNGFNPSSGCAFPVSN